MLQVGVGYAFPHERERTCLLDSCKVNDEVVRVLPVPGSSRDHPSILLTCLQ